MSTEKTTCICGSIVSNKNLSAHCKTKKHLEVVGNTKSKLKCMKLKDEAEVVADFEKKGMLVSEQCVNSKLDEIKDEMKALSEKLEEIYVFIDECYQSLFDAVCSDEVIEEDVEEKKDDSVDEKVTN